MSRVPSAAIWRIAMGRNKRKTLPFDDSESSRQLNDADERSVEEEERFYQQRGRRSEPAVHSNLAAFVYKQYGRQHSSYTGFFLSSALFSMHSSGGLLPALYLFCDAVIRLFLRDHYFYDSSGWKESMMGLFLIACDSASSGVCNCGFGDFQRNYQSRRHDHCQITKSLATTER